MSSTWSRKNPNLQLAVDGTSISTFKTCNRKYELRILRGYTPREENVHLRFGILLHAAHELYARARFLGRSHEESVKSILKWAMKSTWDYKLNRPWTTGHSTKNRFSLMRTIVWYLDNLDDDVLETLRLSNGKPAVELPFTFSTRYFTRSTNEEIMYCGHFDRIALFNGEPFIIDVKTTSRVLSDDYFKEYTPDNQFSGYAAGGRISYEVEIRGLIVDAIQVTASFSRFRRGYVERSDFQLQEWQRDLEHWLSEMEKCAVEGYWPQNDEACFRCEFRQVCSLKSESSREETLQAAYLVDRWDPLERRGDI